MDDTATLYHGGEVYTVDDKRPRAEAVAVEGPTIRAVGTREECVAGLPKDFEEVDLKGDCLFPGFIDTHLHTTGMIIYDMYGDLRGVAGMAELERKIQELAAKDPGAKWVMALELDEHELREKRLPDRSDLDRACPDRPCMIVKRDGHTIILNSKALAECNVFADTPDPEGGRIGREADGRPDGRFFEEAVQVPLKALPMPEIETILRAAGTSFERLASSGITSAGTVLQTDEEGVFGDQGKYDLFLTEIILERIPVNLYCMLVARDPARILKAREGKLHQPDVPGGHRINGYKFWADGTFGSRTACLEEPYADAPDQCGFLLHKIDDMYERMEAAHDAGLQIMIHAIGDKTVATIVDLYERLLKEKPRQDHRHRVEHASLVNPAILEKAARLGLLISTQPMFIHSEKSWLGERLGPARTPWTYPFRAMIDAGLLVAGASDAPIESVAPLHAIQVCVTRDGFETSQCISVEEAVRMFTVNAAFAQFEEGVKGSIQAGKRADLVVLSANPVTTAPDKIKDVQVLRTVCGGRTIFEA